jgi:hypothetical protein
MPALINGKAIADAVALDGLPRVAIDDAGAQHVLYLPEGIAIPHSMLAADWPGALPTDPTPAESSAAIAAREAARGNRQAAALLRRQRTIDLAESAVGVKVGALTPRQVEALLGLLLLQAGALDDALEIRPLDEWAE